MHCIFIDNEFTDFIDIRLISLVLVSSTGEENCGFIELSISKHDLYIYVLQFVCDKYCKFALTSEAIKLMGARRLA